MARIEKQACLAGVGWYCKMANEVNRPKRDLGRPRASHAKVVVLQRFVSVVDVGCGSRGGEWMTACNIDSSYSRLAPWIRI